MKKYIFILIGGLILIGMIGCKKTTEKQQTKFIIDDSNDRLISIGYPPPDDRDSITPDGQKMYSQNYIFYVVEEFPSFPGGERAMYEYLDEKMKTVDIRLPDKKRGKVTCQFIVEKDGSISNVKVVRGVHGLWDNEAIRIINQMPKWIPGKQGGNAVRVRYTLPITFDFQ